MADWIYWIVAAGILIIVEITTGTFYLLMIALGLAAGGAVAWLDYDLSWQLVAAAAVGVAATLALHFSRFGTKKRIDPARDVNVNIDIGRTVTVTEWRIESGRRPTARVSYRGAQWDVDLADGEEASGGVFTICALHGSRLVVTRSPE
jgi:membrane protein implicated in regulation of membrane protease activity